MPKTSNRKGTRWWLLIFMATAGVCGWLIAANFLAIDIVQPVQFSLKQGSGLRSAARQLQASGVLESAWRFEISESRIMVPPRR